MYRCNDFRIRLRKFCVLLSEGKVIVLILLVYRHILCKDALHLLPNLVLRTSPLNETNAAEEQGKTNERRQEDGIAHGSLSSAVTVPIHDAGMLIGAVCALGANIGLGTSHIARADGLEDNGEFKRPADSGAIHKGGGKDDDAGGILGSQLVLQNFVGIVVRGSAGILHALFHHRLVNLGMGQAVIDAFLAGKVIFIVAPKHELIDVIPPFTADSIFLSILVPDTGATETLRNDVGTRYTLVQVIVGVGGAIAAVVGAKVVALILPVGPLASGLDSVVDVHMGSEVGPIAEGLGGILELLLEVLGNEVGGGRPEVVLDPIVGTGEAPCHLDADGVVGHHLGLDGVGVLLEHEEGRDGNVGAGSVVGHDGLSGLAVGSGVGMAGISGRTQAGVVGDDDTGGTGPLGVAHLLHKGTSAPIDHENVRAGPRQHVAVIVLGSDGIALPRIDCGIAQIAIGVVQILLQRATVRGYTEEGLPVVVASGLIECLRNLKVRVVVKGSDFVRWSSHCLLPQKKGNIYAKV